MLPEKEIERTKRDLVELHERVLTDYLTRQGLSFRGRKKFFHIYHHYINTENIHLFFNVPCKILVKAIIKDKLDDLAGIGPILERKRRKHSRKKNKSEITF